MKSKQFLIAILLAGFFSSIVSAQEQRFKISLAEWSLHRAIGKKDISNLDFPRITKTVYGLDAVEYVSSFFRDKAEDTKYLTSLKDSCNKYGVKSLLIMVDGEGNLADSSAAVRQKAIENHYKWVKAAQFLGCHTIRVNAAGRGTMGQMQAGAIDALTKLADYAAPYNINVCTRISYNKSFVFLRPSDRADPGFCKTVNPRHLSQFRILFVVNENGGTR